VKIGMEGGGRSYHVGTERGGILPMNQEGTPRVLDGESQRWSCIEWHG
jgi:hypothetical protein